MTCSQAAREEFQGLAFAEEPAIRQAPIVPFVVPSGFRITSQSPGRDYVPDQRQLNSFGDRFRGLAGRKTFTAETVFYFHELTYTQLKSVLTAILGEEIANGALVINGGGVNNESQAELTSGTPAPVVQVEDDEGVFHYLPVKQPYVAPNLIFAVKLPAGRSPVAVKNPSEVGGGIFQYTAIVGCQTTFQLQLDRRNQPGETQWIIRGATPNALSINFEEGGELGFTIGWVGSDHETGSAPDVGDPVQYTRRFLSFAADIALQDLATPVALPVPRLSLRSFALPLSPEITEETGTPGIFGGEVPPSNVTGFSRGPAFSAPLELGFTYPDPARFTEEADPTAADLFYARFVSGIAGGSESGSTVVLHCPRTGPTGFPVLAVNNGIEGMNLSRQVERDTDHTSPVYLAFFNRP